MVYTSLPLAAHIWKLFKIELCPTCVMELALYTYALLLLIHYINTIIQANIGHIYELWSQLQINNRISLLITMSCIQFPQLYIIVKTTRSTIYSRLTITTSLMAEDSTNQRPLQFPQMPFVCMRFRFSPNWLPKKCVYMWSDLQWTMPQPVTEDSPSWHKLKSWWMRKRKFHPQNDTSKCVKGRPQCPIT